MFVHDPNRKGNIAEAAIALAATKLGVPVYKPVAEHGRADMVLGLGGRLLRVQCKWAKLDRRHGVVVVNLACSYLTAKGYVRTKYTEDEIDLVAAYCGDLERCYLFPGSLIAGRRAIQLRISPPRNHQRACINLERDFRFEGAVAQLEERLGGTQEAGGSSPPSSIASAAEPTTREVGCHEFRNHFGYYLDRAAAGDDVLVRRYGRPYVRLSPAATPQLSLPPPPEARAA